MKTKSLSLTVTLIMMFVVGGFLVMTRLDEGRQPLRSNDPMPYIYYYSNLENGFVIERADGSDSRIIGQGLMPDYNGMNTVSFSPSGEWVAGLMGEPYYGRLLEPFILHVDGTQTISILDDALDVQAMAWASNQDYLAVLMSTRMRQNRILRIIDVAKNLVVTEVTLNIIEDVHLLENLYWAHDDLSVSFAFYHYPTRGVVRLNTSGTSDIWLFSERNPLIYYGDNFLVTRETEYRDFAYHYNWILTDLNTDQSQIFATAKRDDIIQPIDYQFYWNNTRTQAIVEQLYCVTERLIDCEVEQLYVYDWQTNFMSALPTAMRIIENPNETANWDTELWSPDNNLFLLRDDNRTLYLLDLSSHELSLAIEIDYSDHVWLSTGNLFLNSDDDDFVYNVATNSTATIANYSGDFISPMGHYRVRSDSNYAWSYNTVEDVSTGEKFVYQRHSIANLTTSIRWHESENWLFIGGGFDFGSYAIKIHYINDYVGRELTVCDNVQTCAGFVPDHVLRHLGNGLETSVTPSPIYTLLHDNFVAGLAWHHDGLMLATYSVNGLTTSDSTHYLNIWDFSSETPTLRQKFSINHPCNLGQWNHWCEVEWLDDNQLSYWTIDNNTSALTQVIIDISSGDTFFGDFTDSTGHTYPSNYVGNYELEFSDNTQPQAFVINRQTQERVSDIALQEMRQIREYPINYNAETNLLAVWFDALTRIEVWDVGTGEYLAQLPWSGRAEFNPSGTQLAGYVGRVVAIWDMTPYIEQVNE